MKFNIQINKGHHKIVDIHDFFLESEKINFLLGESGIGKSLISKAIFGLLDPQKLQVVINGNTYSDYLANTDISEIQKNGFFVFQEPSTHFNPLLKIGTQLKEGSLGTGKNESDILEKLWQDSGDDKFLSLLKVYPKPYRPSGGEKQRILLAMAFKKIDQYIENSSMQNPLFIFDEPTGSLDDRLRNLFLELLFNKFREKQFTILFITHDYSIISEVINKHNNLVNFVEFKELIRKNVSVYLNKFSSQKYLNWLRANENKKKSYSGMPGLVLLTLNSEISVFGKNLKIYKDKKTKSPVPLKIHQNEIVYLKAPSGAGKTTVAKIIMGLIQAESFQLKINTSTFDQNTSTSKWKKEIWGKQITMSFQHADEALNLNSTVKQTLSNLPGYKYKKTDELLVQLKNIFELDIDESFLKKRIWQLSGGQKQRLNIVRTFLLTTPIMILDEPLNGLDFESITKVIDLLITRKNEGAGVFIISHNEEILSKIVNESGIYYLSEI